MKRALDLVVAFTALVVTAPIIAIACLFIWIEDRANPLYKAPRVGKDGRPFQMVKLRSMVVGADCSGVDSTSASDCRITQTGRWLRRLKFDELPQLWNVVKGEMSLVGPRPNVPREVALYTAQELRLLEARPGVTDLASIVFSDEAEILRDHSDPDIAYNRLVRPWKSSLGLFYMDHRSIILDVRILVLTVLAMASRSRALASISRYIALKGHVKLADVALRVRPLKPAPPPGAARLVTSRAQDSSP